MSQYLWFDSLMTVDPSSTNSAVASLPFASNPQSAANSAFHVLLKNRKQASLRARVWCLGALGAWRVLVYLRPEDAFKESNAAAEPVASHCSPFQVKQAGDGVYRFTADVTSSSSSSSSSSSAASSHKQQQQQQRSNMSTLELRLKPFSIKIGNLDFSSFVPQKLYPSMGCGVGNGTDSLTLATGESNPFVEHSDGYHMGGGWTARLEDVEGRKYYGTGERIGPLARRETVNVNWNTDCWLNLMENTQYQSHPFMLCVEPTKETYGVFLDESWKTTFDITSSDRDATYLSTTGPTFDLLVFGNPATTSTKSEQQSAAALPAPAPNAGSTPASVLSDFTGFVGRAAEPPLWAFGYHQCRWSYHDATAVERIVSQYEEEDIPLEVMWLDIDYMEGYKVFTHHPQRFPNMPDFLKSLKNRGVRVVPIVDPGVKKEAGYSVYEQGKSNGYFVTDRKDQELCREVWPDPAVFPDFSRTEVRDWWSGLIRDSYLSWGMSGIWIDMNEPAVFNASKTLPIAAKHGASFHAEKHNLYAYDMAKATSAAWAASETPGSNTSLLTASTAAAVDMSEKPFVLTRGGFSGVQKYAWVWTGDNSSSYFHMAQSMCNVLSLGLCGVPFTGSDIGGFSADCTSHLLSRWSWLGIFYPFMRNHAAKGCVGQEPWAFDDETCQIVRSAIRFRYLILPYLYTEALRTCTTGVPALRPLMMDYPHDEASLDIDDQWLYGSALMGAPILRAHATTRSVRLPGAGTAWQDLFTGQVHTGDSDIVSHVPANRTALYQLSGTAIPLQSSTARSTSDDRYLSTVAWRVFQGTHVSSPTSVATGSMIHKATTTAGKAEYMEMHLSTGVSAAETNGESTTQRLDMSFRTRGEVSQRVKSMVVELALEVQPRAVELVSVSIPHVHTSDVSLTPVSFEGADNVVGSLLTSSAKTTKSSFHASASSQAAVAPLLYRVTVDNVAHWPEEFHIGLQLHH